MRRIAHYFDTAGKVVGGLAALVGLVSGVIGLVYLIHPSATSSPPAAIRGHIDFVGKSGTPPFRTWLITAGKPLSGYTPRELDKPGTQYELRLSLTGLQKEKAAIVWTLYDVRSKSPVGNASWINQPGADIPQPAPAAMVAKIWIPQPPFRGSFFALVDLDMGRTTLDSQRTPQFVGRAVQAQAVTPRPEVTIAATVRLATRRKTSGCVLGPLPDRACSPGGYDTKLTTSVVCNPSFRSIYYRDMPETLRNAVRREYGLPVGPYGVAFETDHIVPIELGGSNDIANLFPEGAPGFYAKDRLENKLHDVVCSGKMALRVAQRQIATNWIALYKRMFGVAPRTR